MEKIIEISKRRKTSKLSIHEYDGKITREIDKIFDLTGYLINFYILHFPERKPDTIRIINPFNMESCVYLVMNDKNEIVNTHIEYRNLPPCSDKMKCDLELFVSKLVGSKIVVHE